MIRNQSLYPAELRDRVAFPLRNARFSGQSRSPAESGFAEQGGNERHSPARQSHNFGHTVFAVEGER